MKGRHRRTGTWTETQVSEGKRFLCQYGLIPRGITGVEHVDVSEIKFIPVSVSMTLNPEVIVEPPE